MGISQKKDRSCDGSRRSCPRLALPLTGCDGRCGSTFAGAVHYVFIASLVGASSLLYALQHSTTVAAALILFFVHASKSSGVYALVFACICSRI
jgi:hypothetical protein